MTKASLDPRALGGMGLDALREVGNIGAGNAARALSTMVGEPVEMSVASARAVAIERVPDEVGDQGEPVAAAHLKVVGDAPGDMVYLVSLPAARRMTGMILASMGAPPEPEDSPVALTEMQLSVLQEVGNVVASSYLNALSQMTGLHMEPTPPALGVDIAASLLSAVVAEVAIETDIALLIVMSLGVPESTDGGDAGSIASGRFVYLPTAHGLAVVLRGLGLRA
jgi:chemotaxis protein CheC